MNDSAVNNTADTNDYNGTTEENNGYVLYDAEEMCQALKGIAPETLSILADQKQVLQLTFLDGTPAYPSFQVSEGRLNPRLSEFFMLSDRAGSDAWALLSWLNTPWDGNGDNDQTLAEYYGVAPLSLITADREVFNYTVFEFFKDSVQKNPIRQKKEGSTTS